MIELQGRTVPSGSSAAINTQQQIHDLAKEKNSKRNIRWNAVLDASIALMWPGPKGHLRTLKSVIFFKFDVDTLLHISISTLKNDLGHFTNEIVLFLCGTNRRPEVFFWIYLPCIRMHRGIVVNNKCGSKHGENAEQSKATQLLKVAKQVRKNDFGKKLKMMAMTFIVELLNCSLGPQNLVM